MRANEMTDEQKTAAVERAERYKEILADYQQQYGFELPEPWQICVQRLLLGGLGDPELHLMFETYREVEGKAGRMEPAV
uniref:Uncharacterized protein n=1 Tax=Marinobacter nauticus TaxID=2743 RepID=A0A455WH37_MARNT|nr:hypothetical protein YBY_30210 [Marinobacter nauticus]